MIEIDKNKIKAIAEKNNLSFVSLFGSMATGKTHSKSDVDIACGFNDEGSFSKRVILSSDLDNLFGREDVEVVDAYNASPSMMLEIAKNGKVLYEEKEDNFTKYKILASRNYMETEWLRDLRDKRIKDFANKI